MPLMTFRNFTAKRFLHQFLHPLIHVATTVSLSLAVRVSAQSRRDESFTLLRRKPQLKAIPFLRQPCEQAMNQRKHPRNVRHVEFECSRSADVCSSEVLRFPSGKILNIELCCSRIEVFCKHMSNSAQPAAPPTLSETIKSQIFRKRGKG